MQIYHEMSKSSYVLGTIKQFLTEFCPLDLEDSSYLFSIHYFCKG